MPSSTSQPIIAPNTSLVIEQGARSALNIPLPVEAGATLSVTITSLPQGGVVYLPNGQVVSLGQVLTPYQLSTLIYQAPSGSNGAMGAFAYSVSDGKGGSASETVSLSVAAPPTVEANKAVTVMTGQAGALSIAQPTDAAGLALAITVTALPWAGSVTLANGQALKVGQVLTAAQLSGLLYNAPANTVGSTGSFSYSVSDGHGGSASETVSLVTKAPLVVEASRSVTVAANGSRTVLNITGPSEIGDYNGIVATVTAVPSHGSITMAGSSQPVTVGQKLTAYQLATLLYNGPATGSGAMGAFSYSVTDGLGSSGAETITLSVTPPPMVEANKAVTVVQGQSGALAIAQPTDPAGLPISITVTGLPWQGAVTLSTGQAVKVGQVLSPAQLSSLVYNAPAGTAGSSGAFSYSVSDGQGGVSSETVTLGVKAVLVVEASKAVSIANAGGAIALNITPPSETANYNGLSVTVTGVPSKGTITMGGSGLPLAVGQILTPYQLATLIYRSPAGATGAMGAFSYSVTDGQGGSASETVTVTVGTNHAPVAEVNKTVAANFNGSAPLSIAAPTDADGDALSITVTSVPTGALVTGAGKAVAIGSVLTVADLSGLVYTAPAGQSGAMGGFSYTVSDGRGGSTSETVTLTVDHPPVAEANKIVAVNFNGSVPLSIAAPTDADGDVLSITVTSVPTGALVTGAGKAVAIGSVLTVTDLTSLVYTAPSGQSGAVGGFGYTVSDGRGGSASETVTLTVDHPPVAEANKIVAVNFNGSVPLSIAAPTDADGDVLSITVTSVPTGALVTGAGKAVAIGSVLTVADLTGLVYTAPSGQSGAMGGFSYTVSDGRGGSASETVTLTVDHPPVAEANKSLAVNFNSSAPLTIAAPTDADGDALSITVTSVPNGTLATAAGTVVAAGSVLTVAQLTGLVFTAPAGQSGAMGGFSYTVSDGRGGSASETVTLTVNPSPFPTWVNAINDPVIKAAMQAVSSAGTVTEAGMATLFTNLANELTASGQTLSASQFNDLKSVAASLNVGESASSYLSYITNALVNGNAQNATWTGGANTSTTLGNLGVGATAMQFNELTGKWFLGSDMPVSSFTNLDASVPQVTNFSYQAEAGPLFAAGGPSVNDVNQRGFGDCFFLGTIAEIAAFNPSDISSMFVDNGNGTYGVRFFVNGQADWVTINNDLPVNNQQMVGNRPGSDGALWASLLEKAYAQLSAQGGALGGDQSAFGNSFTTIGNGGGPNAVLNLITDTQTTFMYASASSALSKVQAAIAAGDDVVLNSNSNGTDSQGLATLIGNHAMSVIGYDAATGELIIRNPWGTAPQQGWDTTFEEPLSVLVAANDSFSIDNAGALGPVVTAGQGWVKINGATALSSLFAVNDPHGNTITNYEAQIVAGTGSFGLNGATNLATAQQTAQGIVVVSAADFAKLTYVGGAAAGTASIGLAAQDATGWSSIANATVSVAGPKAVPVVTAISETVAPGTVFNPSSLFTVVDPNGNPITAYLFDPRALGNGTINLNGATNIGTASQQAAGYVMVSAADLSKLTVVMNNSEGTGSITIYAYDANGQNPGGLSSTATITTLVPPPVVSAGSTNATVGQSISVSSLFTTTCLAGDTLTEYSFEVEGGAIQLNGATNLVASYGNSNLIEVNASDLSKLTFVAKTGGTDTIQIDAKDAYGWGQGAIATIGVAYPQLPPTVIASAPSRSVVGGTLALSNLFTATDVSGNIITDYLFQAGGGGSIALNGATNIATSAQVAQGIVEIAASDLSKLTFVVGGSAGAESVSVSAEDACGWSQPVAASITAIAPPQVTARSVSLTENQSVAVSTLFSASDPNGYAITQYYIQNVGGIIQLNGAANLTSASGVVEVAASDLSKLTFVADATPGSDQLWVEAYDGALWSGWSSASITVTPPIQPPNVAGKSMKFGEGSGTTVSSMFTASDPNGNAITDYLFQAGGGGSIRLNGATNIATSAQVAQGAVEIAASDLSKLTFFAAASAGVETLSVAAEDINGWSSTATTTITVFPPPLVTGKTVSLLEGQSTAVSSLFSVSDPGGLAIVYYEFQVMSGASINLNGASNLMNSVGYCEVSASDMAKLTLVAGSTVGAERLSVAAYDGASWSAWGSTTINAVAPNVVTENTALVNLTAPGQTINVLNATVGGTTITANLANGALSSSATINGTSGTDTLMLTDASADASHLTLNSIEVLEGSANLTVAQSQLKAGGGSLATLVSDSGSGTLTMGGNVDLTGTTLSGFTTVAIGANVTANAGANTVTLTGSQAGGDVMSVGANSAITASGGNNLVHGAGQDSLILSSSGSDTVAFNSASEGGDTIANFVSGTDKIQVFSPNFGNVATGALGTADFYSGANVTNSNSQAKFLWDTVSHTLYYDGNGNPGAAVEIAHFTNNTQFAKTDIIAVNQKAIG